MKDWWRKVKILLVAPEYPPYSHGGGGVVSQVLAQKLAWRGHDVTVIAGCHEQVLSRNYQWGYEGKVKVVWIPLIRVLEAAYPQIQGSLPPNLKSLLFLKNIDYDDFDVIHLFAFGHLHIDLMNLIVKSSRKILTVHGFPKYVGKEGGAGLPLKLLYKMYFETLGRHTLNSAKMVTAVSKFVAEECIKRGVPKEKILVIPNGIELKKYKPTQYGELEEEFHLEAEDILILSIARVSWQKGLEYALEAIHKVIKVTDKPIKYMIVGPIEDRNYYLRLIRQAKDLGLKENVIFTGFLGEKKMQALTRANIFLAPSIHESFGLAVLEAMALGKPIIASNCEGLKCIIDHMKTGILVRAADSAEIADAILKLLSDSNLQKRLSKNALSIVKKYDWENRLNEYERVYREISIQ